MRRYFRFGLRSLFLLTLVAASFFGGYSLAMRQAEQRVQNERALRQASEELSRQRDAETLPLQEPVELRIISPPVFISEQHGASGWRPSEGFGVPR